MPGVGRRQEDAQKDDAKWAKIVLDQVRKCPSTQVLDKRYKALKLTKAQAKLLECVFYGQGAMYGSTKLYQHIASLDKDNKGKATLRKGDTVVRVDANGDRVGPLNVLYSVHKVLKGGKGYRLALKSGAVDNDTHPRNSLRLVTGITKRQVRGWLKHQTVWQLSTRPRRGYRPDRPFTQAQPGKTLQVDLINIMDKDDKAAEGVALMVIDVFTRMAWAEPVASKTASSSSNWLESARGAGKVGEKMVKLLEQYIFAGPDKKPPAKLRISCDNGPEFSAAFRRAIVEYATPLNMKVEFKYGIPNVPTSQAYVERLNQSVKAIMYRLRDSGRSAGWQYNLQVAVLKYNKTQHTLHKKPPLAVWNDVIQNPDKEYVNTEAPKESVPEVPLNVGDFVRVRRGKKDTGHFYRNNYTDQIFTIREVFNPQKRTKYSSARIKYTLDPYTDTDNIQYVRGGKDRQKPRIKYLRWNLLHIPDGTPYDNPRMDTTASKFEKWCEKCDLDFNKIPKS